MGTDVKGRALVFPLSGMGEPLQGSEQRRRVSAAGFHVSPAAVWRVGAGAAMSQDKRVVTWLLDGAAWARSWT